MTTIPPRLAPILAQYEFGFERVTTRLEGLTDDEYFWEPVAGCWSVRRRLEQRTSASLGGGDWILERERIEQGPLAAGPMTTLAWRIAHLAGSIAMRADYTTGTKSLSYDTWEMPGSAADGIAALSEAGSTWLTILRESTDVDIDRVGRSSFPLGLDPTLPFLDITWWVNQELLHHGGEIGVLRDLYAGWVMGDG